MQGEMQHIVEHCVENPEYHRLTAQNLSIEVTQPTTVRNAVVSDSSHSTLRQAREGSPPISLGGYWEWNASNNQTVEPLYTRYQPLSCIGVADCQSPPATLDRFSPYRFVWTSNFNLTERLHAGEGIDQDIVPHHFVDEEILRNLIRLRSLTRVNDTICIVGDSHARQLVEFLTPQMENRVIHVVTEFADDLGENIAVASGSLSNSSVEDQVNRYLLLRGGLLPRQCAVFFVGLGSWVRTRKCLEGSFALPSQILSFPSQDAAYPRVLPTPVSYYQRNMLRTVKNLQVAAPTVKIYLSNINPMALGECKSIQFHIMLISQLLRLTFTIVSSQTPGVSVPFSTGGTLRLSISTTQPSYGCFMQ
jgi:hypothetical protein